jgi:two-component system sensor histidine kinase BaeS
VQVPPPGLGAEFEELVTGFNDMARRLDGVEETRRRLLADLAHELRTPVATLAAYLEAVEDGVTVLDADALAVMQAQTGRLTRLAQDVSAVSRAEEGHRTLDRRPTPAATLVTTAYRSAAADRYAANGVLLEHVIAPGLPVVEVDVERIAQVLGNLLDNALRHTPRGGRVTVIADTRDGQLRLRVTDTGIGITAEHLPHVFERFYRADAARDRGHGGSGIGLAIVKAYVQGHDGHVTAASNGPGQGTTVTITLPATALTTF